MADNDEQASPADTTVQEGGTTTEANEESPKPKQKPSLKQQSLEIAVSLARRQVRVSYTR